MDTVPDLAEVLHEAHRLAQTETPSGQVAHYIPELAKADPTHVGIAIATLDGQFLQVGDTCEPFTLQSISKVFALAWLLRRRGAGVFDSMSVEPSGDAFHSIVRLEEERGRPRNPYINAGAIMVSDRLPGRGAAARIVGLQQFLAGICDGESFAVDEATYRSEAATGFRNRALANLMKHHGLIGDPNNAAETYFRQCSILVSAASLARLGLFLANKGRDPATGRRLLAEADNRTVVALMATCGLYDEVGRFAVTVGLPAKSGVSGAILAVVPGRMAIAAFGPALGPKGNSVAGMRALAFLSDRLGLSLYG